MLFRLAKYRQASLMAVLNLNFSWKIFSLISSSFRKSVYCKAISITLVPNVLCKKKRHLYLVSPLEFITEGHLQFACSTEQCTNTSNETYLQPFQICSVSKYIYHDNRFFCLQKAMYHSICSLFASLTLKRTLTIFKGNILSKFANLSIF